MPVITRSEKSNYDQSVSFKHTHDNKEVLDDIATHLNAKVDKLNFITKTSNYTAVADDFIYIDTTAGSFTVTLPLNPAINTQINFLDIGGSLEINPLTVARNGQTIMGLEEDLIADMNATYFRLIFNGTDWRVL